MKEQIKIIFQHFHGCPNGPKLLENLKQAIKGIEEKVNIVEQIIDTPELAMNYKFRGSPTILINGEDIEGMSVPETPQLSCRFYPNGIPTTESIQKRIKYLIDTEIK